MKNTDYKEKSGWRTTDFLCERFWMKYFCKVMSGERSHIILSAFQTTSYDLEIWWRAVPAEMASGKAESRFIEVLHHFPSSSRVISFSKQLHPQNILPAGTSLSNEDVGWWESLTQQGILIGAN